ncbi:MAG: HEAT repeat domain-containing protein [Woeseiaceae bacterium]
MIGGLAFCAAGIAADSSVRVSVDGELIAVSAADVRVREVLEAIARHGSLEIRSAAPLDRRVTLDTAAVPLADLLRQLLPDHSYVLFEEGADGRRSLWILTDGEDGESGGWRSGRPFDEALDRAIVALGDPDAGVREEAVLTLGAIGGTGVIPYLSQALTDGAPGVRAAASAVLDNLDAGRADASYTREAGTE